LVFMVLKILLVNNPNKLSKIVKEQGSE